jgi:hypothetical protein
MMGGTASLGQKEKTKFAMVAMIIPLFFNWVGHSFIKVIRMTGAAYATSISILCVSYLYFGSSFKSEIKPKKYTLNSTTTSLRKSPHLVCYFLLDKA